MSFLGGLIGGFIGADLGSKKTIDCTKWTYYCLFCEKEVAQFDCIAWEFEEEAAMVCEECQETLTPPHHGNK
jgi:predicted SprT family Zn-dependent metalloprotease